MTPTPHQLVSMTLAEIAQAFAPKATPVLALTAEQEAKHGYVAFRLQPFKQGLYCLSLTTVDTWQRNHQAGVPEPFRTFIEWKDQGLIDVKQAQGKYIIRIVDHKWFQQQLTLWAEYRKQFENMIP